ncbi:MAG: SEC-C metal-binding domain-containing protein, partial [Deltaproteobacteria bacterium]|nr:SEC-C metal-binding domain-containing protein [Deltaproteobacteria bacterium]
SVQFVGSGFKLIVDSEPLLDLRADSDGHLLLNLDVYDSSDQLLLTIRDNEWITGDPFPWDFEYSYNLLKLRRADRDISIVINARVTPLEIKGEFWRKGQHFSIHPDNLIFNGVVSNVGFSNLGLVAISLVVYTSKQCFAMAPDPRFGQGIIVSWPYPLERLRKGIEAFEKLCRETKVGRNNPCLCGSGKKAKHCHQR